MLRRVRACAHRTRRTRVSCFRARRAGKVERAHLALQGLDVSLTLTAEIAQFGRQVLDHLTPPRRQHVSHLAQSSARSECPCAGTHVAPARTRGRTVSVPRVSFRQVSQIASRSCCCRRRRRCLPWSARPTPTLRAARSQLSALHCTRRATQGTHAPRLVPMESPKCCEVEMRAKT